MVMHSCFYCEFKTLDLLAFLQHDRREHNKLKGCSTAHLLNMERYLKIEKILGQMTLEV